VRLVFDAVTASLNSNTTKQALLTRAPQSAAVLGSLLEEDEDGNVPGIRRASDQLKANRREVAAPVINLLEHIVESRSAELAQICRSVLLSSPTAELQGFRAPGGGEAGFVVDVRLFKLQRTLRGHLLAY
jgi:hypothetical protein